MVCDPRELADLSIVLTVDRAGKTIFSGRTTTQSMKRSFDDLVSALYAELSFPGGVFLMTGTGIVPPDDFSLAAGDRVQIEIGSLRLVNAVAPSP